MDSPVYAAAATSGESTCLPAVVVEGLGFDAAAAAAVDDPPPVSKSSVSLPLLPAADTPLQLLVEMPPGAAPPPQPPARREAPSTYLLESGDGVTVTVTGLTRDQAQRVASLVDAPPVKPPQKRLRQKKHVCDICGHRCSYPKDLKRHKFKHLNEKFPCTECDVIYNRPDKLADHVRLTHRDSATRRRVACPVDDCDYRAVDNHHVQKHVRDRHSDERPYSCQVCSYSAKHVHQLTVHLRSHTGDCPYVCPVEQCGKAYRTTSDLRRHQLYHSGEQPFTCELCDFASAFIGNVYKHMRTIHGVERKGKGKTDTNVKQETDKSAAPAGKPRHDGGPGRGRNRGTYRANFWCDKCSASFVRKESYLVHLGTHNPAVPRARSAAAATQELAAPPQVPPGTPEPADRALSPVHGAAAAAAPAAPAAPAAKGAELIRRSRRENLNTSADESSVRSCAHATFASKDAESHCACAESQREVERKGGIVLELL